MAKKIKRRQNRGGEENKKGKTKDGEENKKGRGQGRRRT